MILFCTLQIGDKQYPKSIHFGEADNDDELLEAYKLRYEIYSKLKYIDSNNYPTHIEKDDYDESKKCKYFLAKLDNVLVGFIRLIIDHPLPTEKAFIFEEPEEMKTVSHNERGELGRFIIVSNRHQVGYFPRRIIMLFLLYTLSSYGMKSKILGGYSFVKKSLLDKLDKLGMPLGKLDHYKQIYPKGGVLYNYFNQPIDPVIPIYFITKKFHEYSEKNILNSKIFLSEKPNSFMVRKNLYTRFLKKLQII